MADEGEITTLDFTSYPMTGDKSAWRSITFGPASSNFAFLIEVDGDTGDLRVTVGNGPEPEELPALLMEAAEILEGMIASPEFQSVVNQ